jgi:hypothetical protein
MQRVTPKILVTKFNERFCHDSGDADQHDCRMFRLGVPYCAVSQLLSFRRFLLVARSRHAADFGRGSYFTVNTAHRVKGKVRRASV